MPPPFTLAVVRKKGDMIFMVLKSGKWWVLLTLITALLIPLMYYGVKNLARLAALLSSFEEFREYILGFGAEGIIIFIVLQAVQVLVPAIPSEAVQSAGGYIYGPLLGLVFSTSGILIGGMVAFFAARYLGRAFMVKLFKESRLQKFEALVKHRRFNAVVFLIFLLPGMPKDMLNYAAGFSPVKAGTFFATTTLARLPGTLAAVYIGAALQERDFSSMTVLLGVLLTMIAAGMIIWRRSFS